MSLSSAWEIWNASPRELEIHLNSKVNTSRQRKICFYAPSFTYYKTSSFASLHNEFPTVSVTGNICSLNCRHCGGKVLETMHATTTPDKLVAFCAKLKRDNALGVLVSGGCLPDGVVPLHRFIPALAEVKQRFGLTVFVHTGIVDEETASCLKSAGVDAALLDVIGCDETIRQVYNLDVSTKCFENSLKALHKGKMPFVPHVVVGLHNGELKGEFAALRMIEPYQPSAIVIIGFMPIRGTAMAVTTPPSPHDIARTIAAARAIFPQTPIVLGCMRPKGRHRSETDVLALKAGVDGIAFPSQEAIRFVRKAGFLVTFLPVCCAQIYVDLVET